MDAGSTDPGPYYLGASICCTPGSGSDCMFGYIGEDYFRPEPLSDAHKARRLPNRVHRRHPRSRDDRRH